MTAAQLLAHVIGRACQPRTVAALLRGGWPAVRRELREEWGKLRAAIGGRR
jgi:hypothetical protein